MFDPPLLTLPRPFGQGKLPDQTEVRLITILALTGKTCGSVPMKSALRISDNVQLDQHAYRQRLT